MSDGREIVAYVEKLEAMLRPVAGDDTAALIELLQLVAWQHEECASYLRADGKEARARVFRLSARAIRDRVIELRRSI